MDKKNREKILKAGKIAKQVREYAEQIIKENISLLEIAEKIEAKIKELGGKPAFPTNLCINDIAAHYTPSYNDESIANGLLKIDLGVQIDGWIADTAFSLDLEGKEENKKLIDASKKALDNSIKIIKKGTPLNQIGKTIQDTIESFGFSPIKNLSGHSLEQYDLHSGITIPNIDDKKNILIEEGLFAIEPFATSGAGKIYEGKPSGIYTLINHRNIRDSTAREILQFIKEEYKTLPFCSRWIVKKFGTKALFRLKQLENNGNLHQFPQLIELLKAKVAQTEHTILIGEQDVIVTTK